MTSWTRVSSSRKTNSRRTSPSWVEIDLEAIRANARAAVKFCGNSSLLAVVKEDGYGHGGHQVARALSGLASGFGVATLEQGIDLRRGGVHKGILVMCPVPPAQWPRLAPAGLTPALTCLEDLSRARVGPGHTLEGHVKFDTGMGRTGFLSSQVSALTSRLKRRGVRAVAGAFTHLAQVFEPGFTTNQLDRFEACLAALKRAGIDPGLTHAANSGALYRSRRACAYGAVRPGLILYGVAPGPGVPFRLLPALSFKTRVAQVRDVPAGATVSYGHTWRAPRASRLGLLPAGYSAGFPRQLSGRGSAIVRGRRVPVLGRVCMNLTVVDLSRVPSAKAGDEVTLIGRQGREEIPAGDVARLAGTISYEILCVAGGLNPRLFRGNRGRAGD